MKEVFLAGRWHKLRMEYEKDEYGNEILDVFIDSRLDPRFYKSIHYDDGNMTFHVIQIEVCRFDSNTIELESFYNHLRELKLTPREYQSTRGIAYRYLRALLKRHNPNMSLFWYASGHIPGRDESGLFEYYGRTLGAVSDSRHYETTVGKALEKRNTCHPKRRRPSK